MNIMAEDNNSKKIIDGRDSNKINPNDDEEILKNKGDWMGNDKERDNIVGPKNKTKKSKDSKTIGIP